MPKTEVAEQQTLLKIELEQGLLLNFQALRNNYTFQILKRSNLPILKIKRNFSYTKFGLFSNLISQLVNKK
jgi:hypothetical protein